MMIKGMRIPHLVAWLLAPGIILSFASCASAPPGPPTYIGKSEIPEAQRSVLTIPPEILVTGSDLIEGSQPSSGVMTDEDQVRALLEGMKESGSKLQGRVSFEPGIHTFTCRYEESDTKNTALGSETTKYSADGFQIRKRFEAGKTYTIYGETRYASESDYNKGEPSLLLTIVATGPTIGFIDSTNGKVIDTRYDVGDFSGGFAPFKDNGLWGYLDRSGSVAIGAKFQEACGFSEGLAAVKTGGSWGYIDATGTLVVVASYSDASPFSEGLAAVNKGGRYGYVDKSGAAAIAPAFDAARPFKGGLAPVKTGGLWAFIDKTGAFISKERYEEAYVLSEGLAPVKAKGKWGYIDASGRMSIEPAFFEAYSFSEGLAPVKPEKDGKYGYIGKDGSFVIAPVFDYADYFSEGLACARIQSRAFNRNGYIDKTGAFAIEPSFYETRCFMGGLAAVQVDLAWGYIDKTGAWAIRPEYDWAMDFMEGMARVKQ